MLQAPAEGLAITADMYNYPAGATGLDAAMPPWVQEGGYDAWAELLQDPEIRARLRVPRGRGSRFAGPDADGCAGRRAALLDVAAGVKVTDGGRPFENPVAAARNFDA